MMKFGLYSLPGLVALFLPQISSATLVVGFHSFDDTKMSGTVPPEVADFADFGFSGRVLETTNSSSVGGSSDGTYGASASTGSGTANDGYLRSAGTSDPVIEFTNGNSTAKGLQSLLFDAAKQGPPVGTVGVYYRLGNSTSNLASTDASWQFLNIFSNPPPYTGSNPTSIDFNDYIIDLSTFTLAAGQSIQFLFDMQENGRLDNIALNAIPEASTMLALGGLMTAGAFLRTRRRKPVSLLATA